MMTPAGLLPIAYMQTVTSVVVVALGSPTCIPSCAATREPGARSQPGFVATALATGVGEGLVVAGVAAGDEPQADREQAARKASGRAAPAFIRSCALDWGRSVLAIEAR